jgi:hypothetical protein
MLARVCSAAVNGIEAYPVEVEVEVNVGWGDTLIVIIATNTPKTVLGIRCNQFGAVRPCNTQLCGTHLLFSLPESRFTATGRSPGGAS